jgi:hypothetical protein
MKKVFCILALILILAGTAQAQEWTRASGNKTASAVITTTDGDLDGIIISGTATAAGTATLWDNASAGTGTQLIPTLSLVASSTDGNDRQIVVMFPRPVHFFNGCYLVVTTGAGTVNVEVYYRKR